MVYDGSEIPEDILSLFCVAKMITCYHVPSWQVAEIRKRFKGKLTRKSILFYIPQKRHYKKYELHHIQPLALGGTNQICNLALVEPSLHRRIHAFIDMQSHPTPMHPRELLIPVFNGRIWTLEARP